MVTDILEPSREIKAEDESGSKEIHDPVEAFINVEANIAFEDLRPGLHLVARTLDAIVPTIWKCNVVLFWLFYRFLRR